MSAKAEAREQCQMEEGESKPLIPLKSMRCVESGSAGFAYKQPGDMSAQNKASLKRLAIALVLSAGYG